MAATTVPVQRRFDYTIPQETIYDQRITASALFPSQALVPTGTTVVKGGVYCVNASGVVVVPDLTTSAFPCGVWQGQSALGSTSDTLAGDSSTTYITLTLCGVWLTNSGTNVVSANNIGAKAYLEDNNTVGTVVGVTRTTAGIIKGFDVIDNLVLVDMTTKA